MHHGQDRAQPARGLVHVLDALGDGGKFLRLGARLGIDGEERDRPRPDLVQALPGGRSGGPAPGGLVERLRGALGKPFLGLVLVEVIGRLADLRAGLVGDVGADGQRLLQGADHRGARGARVVTGLDHRPDDAGCDAGGLGLKRVQT